MKKKSLLIIGFNRPAKINNLLKIVTKNPYIFKIYIKIDGPRNYIDKKKILSIKNLIKDYKKKNRNIIVKYENQNLGLRQNIISAINWVFIKEKDIIVLEDDNIPSNDFFTFCYKMLELYKHSTKIMHISGTNFSKNFSKDDYYFSKMPDIVGWATWKSKWKKLVQEFNLNSIIKKKIIKNYYKNDLKICHWFYEYLYREVISTNNENLWSTWWQLTIIVNDGLSINPGKNLVYHDGYLKSDNPVHLNEKANIKNFKLENIKLSKMLIKKIVYKSIYDEDHFQIIKDTDPHFDFLKLLKWKYKFYLRHFRSDFENANFKI
jgi:hypothetical protein